MISGIGECRGESSSRPRWRGQRGRLCSGVEGVTFARCFRELDGGYGLGYDVLRRVYSTLESGGFNLKLSIIENAECPRLGLACSLTSRLKKLARSYQTELSTRAISNLIFRLWLALWNPMTFVSGLPLSCFSLSSIMEAIKHHPPRSRFSTQSSTF